METMSNTRPLYFLKDSLTGKFYTGQRNELGEFATAAIYHQMKNATSRVKGVVEAWEFQRKTADYWIEECKKKRPEDQKWAKKEKDEAIARQDLPDWGVQVVGGTVTV